MIIPIAAAAGIFAFAILHALLAWKDERWRLGERVGIAPGRVHKEADEPAPAPLLQRLSTRIGGTARSLISPRAVSGVKGRLQSAGLRTTVEHFVGLWVILIATWYLAVSALTLYVSLPLWFSALLFAVALLAPFVHLSLREAERTRRLQRAFPFLVDFVTMAVEAGLSLESALVRAGQKLRGPLGEEARRYVQNVNRGMSRRDALLAFADGLGLQEVQDFVHVLNQSGSFGLPLGVVLRRQSEQIRESRRVLAEETAQKLPIKLLFPLVLFIFPTIFLLVLGPAFIWFFELGM